MLHSKYLILPNQFVNSCNSWKFEVFSCHLSFLYKGGYKQILGIEGNSSIATDMSVWDGVSAITRVLLKMVKVSESWSIYIVITLFRAQIRNNTPCIVAFGYVPQKAPHYSLYPPPAIILEPVVHWLDWGRGEGRGQIHNTHLGAAATAVHLLYIYSILVIIIVLCTLLEPQWDIHQDSNTWVW